MFITCGCRFSSVWPSSVDQHISINVFRHFPISLAGMSWWSLYIHIDTQIFIHDVLLFWWCSLVLCCLKPSESAEHALEMCLCSKSCTERLLKEAVLFVMCFSHHQETDGGGTFGLLVAVAWWYFPFWFGWILISVCLRVNWKIYRSKGLKADVQLQHWLHSLLYLMINVK